MRVASASLYSQATLDMLRQQYEIAKSQEQIGSGKRLLTPSDDPVGAARAVAFKEGIEQFDQFARNASAAEQRLALEEGTLDTVTALLQRVRELALAANSGVQTPETRAAYAVEVEQRLQELIGLANTRDANGAYLFAGYKGNAQPFVIAGNSVVYQGDQGQQHLQVGPEHQVATMDPGSEVFQRIRNGNGTFTVGADVGNAGTGVLSAGSVVDASAYQPHSFTLVFTSDTTFDVVNNDTSTTILSGQSFAPGEAIGFNGVQLDIEGTPLTGDQFFVTPSQNQDVFSTLQGFVDAMASNPTDDADRAQLTQIMNGVIGDVDQALTHIVETRTEIGARMNHIDSVRDENDAIKFQFEKSLSDVRDLDYTEAISRLEFQLTALQALQASFSRIAGLSLFNLLR